MKASLIWGKETDIQIQEAQRTPLKISKNRPTPRDSKICTIDKERILKATREKKTLTYKGRQISLAGLSTETWQARREWHDIFNVLNGKNMQPRILYLARLSFRVEGERKSFPDKQKLKEFVTTRPALQEN